MGLRPTKVMKNDGGASFSLQRRLQPAASNFGMFFNGVPMGLRPTQGDEERAETFAGRRNRLPHLTGKLLIFCGGAGGSACV
jgi:hypothetical protein